MAVNLGTAYIPVHGDLSFLNKQLAAFFGGSKFAALSGKLGKRGGLAMGAGLTAGLAVGATGKALFDLGRDFDAAFDTIRVGTGKTGAELGALKDDFKDVFKSLPVSMDDTAAAVTGLNQRLGITGKPLQKLSRQILQLSRITKTDVGTNVAAITRLFGDWSVATENQSGQLNKMFRLTQKTGIGLDDLARLMVKFGSPLRTLGFDFDEAAAMFGRFEREGVNLQTTLPGFKIALKNFAKPTEELSAKFKKFGVDAEVPRKALKQVFELLKTLPRREGTQLAFEVFGSRAASDMFRAVKEGRFEFEDLIDVMNRSGDSINKAEKDTRDFAEQWQMLKNRVFVAIEPIASKFFKSIGDGMEALATADFGKIGADIGFGELDTSGFEAAAKNIKSIVQDLGPVWSFMGAVAKRQLAAIAQIFRGMGQTIKGITQVISGVLSGDFGKAWAGVKNIFGGGVKVALGHLRGMTAPVREIAARVGSGLAGGFRSGWRTVRNVFSDGAAASLRVLRGMVGTAGDIGGRVGSAIATSFRARINLIRGVADAIVGVIKRIPGRLGNIGAGILRALKRGLSGATIIPGFKVKGPGPLPDISFPDVRLPSFAKGGLQKRTSLALVGEEGPELAKLPGGKQVIVGAKGPEVTHLPTHTRVFSHTETKRKLASVVEKVTRVLPTMDGAKVRLGSRMPRWRDRGAGDGDLRLPSISRDLAAGQPHEKEARHSYPSLTDPHFVPSVHQVGTLPASSHGKAPKGSPAGRIREGLGRLTIGQVEAPALAQGGIVPPPAPLKTADPSLRVIRVADGKHVAVRQEGNLPPKVIRVADSLRTLVDKPAAAKVTKLSDVRDRTVRSLVTNAVRRSTVDRDTRRTHHSSSVLERVAKRVGIQAFAKGGTVKPEEVTAITNKWGVNRAVASIGAAVEDKYPAMSIMSGFRSGSRVPSGGVSNHAIRAALDLGSTGSLNRRIGSWVRSQFSKTLRRVTEDVLDVGHDPNPPDHADHVHVAAKGTEAFKKVMEVGGVGGGSAEKPKRITGGSLSLGQMVTLAKQAGFPDPALAAAVGYAESRGKVGAIGDGGDSIGLWQINMPAHKQYKEADLKDARKNAKAALQISGRGKNWKPWTQYRTGAYKPFLGGKSTPLPGGGGGGVTARGTSDADFLAWKLQEAESTEGTTKDDLRWINRGLRYWRKVLQRSKKAGNYKRAGEALSQVTDLREKKKALREEPDENAFSLDGVSSLNAGTVKWNIAGLQPQLDRIDLDIGKAALTETLDAQGNVTPASYTDDIAAATGLQSFWQNVYDATIGKLDLGMQVKAIQGDPSKVKRLADGRYSTKVRGKTYTFSATPGETITVGGQKVTVPGGPQFEKRPGTVKGTGKQQLEAATSLKSSRDALKSITDEAKSEQVPVETETVDAKAAAEEARQEVRSFLASLFEIRKQLGSNFKQLPSFAKGGVSRLPLALVGEQGYELAKAPGRLPELVGAQGPEIRELPVGTRVYSHPDTKRKFAPLFQKVTQKVSRVFSGKTLEQPEGIAGPLEHVVQARQPAQRAGQRTPTLAALDLLPFGQGHERVRAGRPVGDVAQLGKDSLSQHVVREVTQGLVLGHSANLPTLSFAKGGLGMAKQMGIPAFAQGGVVRPQSVAPDTDLARALERIEALMKRQQAQPAKHIDVGGQHLHFSTPAEDQHTVQKAALWELEAST